MLTMSFDRRPHFKAYRFDWSNEHAVLLFNSESSTIASHPSYDGRFCLDLAFSNWSRLIHLTTGSVSIEQDLASPMHDRWLKPFSIFGNVDFAIMRDDISTMMDHLSYLSPEISEIIFGKIYIEVQDAIEKSIFLGHSTLWMDAQVYVLTDMVYFYESEGIDWFQANNSVNVINRGLTKAVIERHIKVEQTDGKTLEEICTVCLDDIGTQIGWMPCNHAFHPDCIKKWLEESNMCPLCRFEVKEISE